MSKSDKIKKSSKSERFDNPLIRISWTLVTAIDMILGKIKIHPRWIYQYKKDSTQKFIECLNEYTNMRIINTNTNYITMKSSLKKIKNININLIRLPFLRNSN